GLPRGPSEESPRRDPLRELIQPPRGLVGWGHIPYTRDCQSIKECLTKSFIVRAVDAAFEQRKEVRMKILLVGSGGHVGGVARAELEKRGHDVIGATRSTDPGVDTSDADSISKLLEAVGVVDAIVVAIGAAAFKPVTELTREDYTEAFVSKTLGQIEFVTQGLDHLSDGGSITFVTGVLSREPVPTASAAAMANG